MKNKSDNKPDPSISVIDIFDLLNTIETYHLITLLNQQKILVSQPFNPKIRILNRKCKYLQFIMNCFVNPSK